MTTMISLCCCCKLLLQNKVLSRKNKELTRNIDQKRLLLSIIAHDLRSPVYQLERMWQQALFYTQQKHYDKLIDTLHNGITMSNSTYNLLNNLLNWVMLQSNQLLYKKESLHLNSIIDQVVHNFQIKAKTKQINISKNIPKNIYIDGDLHTYKIIFQNFIDNAIKYSFHNGIISLTASYINTMEYCKFTIRDYGEGIAPHIIHQLLHTNERTQESSSKKNSMGIGFQLCKELIQKNGATLAIESKKQNGTIITLTIPVSKIN